jgi:16S rRNA A1518/A1519 N6-dimethyltransferase RsmA/KsgA/DIM1 with predicted DNA glycosylase/AP lyase activity
LLRSELATVFKDRLDKPAVDRILGQENLPADVRAEQLECQQLLALSRAVKAEMGV